MATAQKALLLTQVGAPLVLVNDRPIPKPAAKQVQLRVSVAGINPHDHKARDYGLLVATNLPAVLTNDVVGKITALGDGVTGLALGDRIVAQAGMAPDYSQNGLQEFTVADVGALAKIPDSITDDEAATLPTNIVAPLVGLFVTLGIPAPWDAAAAREFDYAAAAVLIVGGGSNCGKFGVQLAKLAGIGTIVVVGGDEAALRQMGATHVVDRHGGHEAVLGRIRDIVGDDLVYAFDAVSPPDGQILAIDALSNTKRGALARLVPSGKVDESKVKGKTAGFDVRDVFGLSQLHPAVAAPFWELVPEYLETGKIRPLEYKVVKGLEAAAVNAVLDGYKSGEKVVKTHVHF